MRLPPRAALLAAVAATLAGCHNSAFDEGTPVTSSNPWPAPGPAPVPAKSTIVPGHLWGTANLEGVVYVTDGALTRDGDLRLHILRADELNIYESFQFFGSFGPLGQQVVGQGAIIGQFCSGPTPTQFCGTATTASIGLAGGSNAVSARLTGELRVPTGTGTDVWTLDLGYYGGMTTVSAAPDLRYLVGLYRERLAEFSPSYDATIDLDATGRFFFQDATTGCTGNGTLAASETNFFAVSLTIGNCSAGYRTLNTEFTGLATFEPAAPWDYWGYAPRMWLSTYPGNAAPAALATDAVAY
jgi:hypothetical protein